MFWREITFCFNCQDFKSKNPENSKKRNFSSKNCLDKAVNFLGIEEGTALMIGLALIFVAGFHFISVVIKFFSEKF